MTMELRGTKTLVVGLEKSGLASIELLASHGAAVRATDLKALDALPGAAAVVGRCGAAFVRQSPEVFDWPELIVLSPGVPADLAPLDPITGA
jgi:UDP-N-acetylmuramoylalanine-D-glutamate ligase